MTVCVLYPLLVVLMAGLHTSYSDSLCQVCPVLTPPSLTVKFGHPAAVNCSVPIRPEEVDILGWEAKTNPLQVNGSSVMWNVTSLTEWEEVDGICCFLSAKNGTQFCTNLNLTIYKSPDSVKLIPEADVWIEGNETKLQCEIKNVGPGHKLSVLWIRDPDDPNVTEQSILNHKSKKNVTEINKLMVIPHRKDNGVQYHCAAVLNLQQRQVYQSQPINITVHYKPVIVEPVGGNFSLTEGEMLVLRCLADSNPPSDYRWSSSDNNDIQDSSINISRAHLLDQGSYTCTASNYLGSTSVTVDIIVTEKHVPIVLICAAVAVVILLAVLICVFWRHYRQTRIGTYFLTTLRYHQHPTRQDPSAPGS